MPENAQLVELSAIVSFSADIVVVVFVEIPSSALDLGRKLINYFDLFPKYIVPPSLRLKKIF